VVSAGQPLSVVQRATLWPGGTHAATAAGQATELMFAAGGSASPYVSGGLERCVRDVHATCQHVTLGAPNYQMACQAFLDLDVYERSQRTIAQSSPADVAVGSLASLS
jgi:indole-3-acetate monooxygenase